MFNIVIGLAAVAFVVYLIGSAIYQYRKTPGTSLLTAFWGSLTILWGRLVMLSGAIITAAATLAGYLGDPALSDAIKGAIDPRYVPIAVVGILLVTEWARKRSLPKS